MLAALTVWRWRDRVLLLGGREGLHCSTIVDLTNLEAVTKGKVTEGLDECKEAIAALEAFGFTVGRISVGMGILPEIHTSISGSIESIREDEL